MGAGNYYAEQWGQTQLLTAPWAPNQERPVLTITTPARGKLAPRVRTLIAGAENGDATDTNYILRWRLAMGVGGSRVTVDFDATRYTRISAPFDEARLSMYADPFPAGGTDVPPGNVPVFAFIADGYAEQSAPGPIFSERFALLVGQQAVIPLPVGANRFRVVGLNDGTSPFTVNTVVFMRRGAASLGYSIPGLSATPGMGDLFGVYGSGDFIPLASGVTQLVVVQSAGVGNGFVQFGLDL